MDLSNLIHRPLKAFFDRKIEHSDISPSDTEEKIIPTTFRLPADIRNYYQLMADASRTTFQGAVLQVLSSVMESHTTYQKAESYALELSDRFFLIFDMAGIPMHKVTKFLKDFNIKHEDLTSNSRIVDLMSDKLISFLADTFMLEKEWISTGKGPSHKEIYCYKNTHTIHGIMQQSPYKLTLKVLFDNSIVSNTTILNGGRRREVYCALIEEPILNDICFKRMYLFHPMTWDYEKTNVTIGSVIEGMEFQESAKRKVELYAYSNDNVDPNKFGISILTDFYGYGENGIIIAEHPSKNIRASKSEFIEVRKVLRLNLEKYLKIYNKCSGMLPDSFAAESLLLLKDFQLQSILYLGNMGYHNGELFPEEQAAFNKQKASKEVSS